MRRSTTTAAAAAALAGLLLVAGCAPADGTATVVDPIEATRTGRPNDALVCPGAACADADWTAPTYAVEPVRLAEAWRGVVAKEPRASVVAEDRDRMLLLARQRSAVFGFADTIALRIVPGPAGGSSFAAYSRAEVGYYDFGVNRRRLEDWQAAVERELGTAGRPTDGS